MKYTVVDSLFEEKRCKTFNQEELMVQFAYLGCSCFDELVEELEASGYRIQPLVD